MLELRQLTRVALLAAALGFSPAASAQSLDDDVWIRISGYLANVDTDVSISPASNPDSGSSIDLEDDLDFDDDEILPAFFAGARLGGRFSLTAEYYSLNRDTSATLDRAITVDDVVYPIAGTVTAGFRTDIYRATVNWAFVRQEDLQVGGAIGLHATDIGFSIEGQGSAGGSPVAATVRQRDLLAPLPTVGLFLNWEFTPGFRLDARGDFLSLSIDDYDGRLINAEAGVSYRLTKNLGIGAMYRFVDYKLEVEKRNYVGRFDYAFNGPSVFLEAGF